MNNAIFGKTMKNVRNHVENVKLIKLIKWDGQYGGNDRETKFSQPLRLCGKFYRYRNAQTRDEIR